MAQDAKPGFSVTFDAKPSRQWPYGYWYASTNDGEYEGVGSNIESAMAALIICLHTALVQGEGR